MAEGALSVRTLCGQFGVSRQMAYKWRRRYRENRRSGRKEKSRRPLSLAVQTSALWLRRVRRLRAQRKTWGARKLRHQIIRNFGRKEAPSAATIGRWLKRWGLCRLRRRRRSGPRIGREGVHLARGCHEVWTVDFKGWHRTARGVRLDPLTVRDLHSR